MAHSRTGCARLNHGVGILNLDNWMGSDNREIQIWPLTGAFTLLYLFAATQDIAVDGWALTMLRPENVGYASTCNSAGQIAGYFLSFTGTATVQDCFIERIYVLQWPGVRLCHVLRCGN